ncbi:TcfC E-set like domain-containing protein [Photobacterium damselae]
MNKIKVFIFSLILISDLSYGYEIPDDFREFYDNRILDIEIISVEGISNDFEAIANYNSLKINNAYSENELRKFFLKIGVKEKALEKIINDFKSENGIKSSNNCIGLAENCVINPSDYAIVFDYDKKTAYFFISPKLLIKKEKEIKYVNNFDKSPAIINSSDLYFGFYDSKYSLSLNNDTIIGLNYGYIDSSFYYNDNNKISGDFDLRKLAYILDYDKYQYQIGMFEGNENLNATGFLSSISDNTKNISFNVHTSKNLISDNNSYYNSIKYYTPSSGYMTVKKDDLIIFQKNVNAGSGEIPYKSLPLGVYSVDVTVKSNGSEVLNQKLYVYNVRDGRLSKGEVDVSASLGIYDEDIPEIDHTTDIDLSRYKEAMFSKASVAYGVSDSAMVGSEVEITEDSEYKLKFGLSYLFRNSSRLDFIFSQYKEDSYSNTVNLTTPWFGLFYDNVNISNDDSFAQYIEGGLSRSSITVNKNFRITSVISSNLGYNYNKYESSSDVNKNWNISADLDYRFNTGSIFNFQLSYENNVSEYNKEDQYLLNLSLTIPLSNNLTYTTQLSTYDDNFDEFRNELSSEVNIGKDMLFNVSTGYSIYGNNYNDDRAYITLNSNYSNNYLSTNLYGYVDSYGEKNINIGMSNTQIFTKDNFYSTSNNAKSYLSINIDNDDDRIKNLGLLTVKNQEKLAQKEFLSKDSSILALDEYKYFNGNIDTESVSLENKGEKKIDGFAFPGSVYNLNPKISKIVTFIAAFDDIFDQNISSIDCEGYGCVSVDHMDGNVFSVKVRSGSEFVLSSGNLVCLTPGVKNIKKLNLGLNHCVPNIEDVDDNILLAGPDGINRSIYFIGIFDKGERHSYLAKLKQFDVIEKTFNDNENLVYVSFKDDYQLSKNEKEIFNQVTLTAKSSSNITPFVLELDKSWFKSL